MLILFQTIYRSENVWQMYRIIIDQGIFNFMNDLYMNGCNMLLKISPSKTHEISHVSIFINQLSFQRIINYHNYYTYKLFIRLK
jgi:hypothetical protein